MGIKIENITKRFNDFTALKDVSLEINHGELIALLGPSGSGKTTLLRIIAGLEKADDGLIFFEGEETSSKKVKDRKVGFVFQHYALFKHMTVFDNVAFGLNVMNKSIRPQKKEIKTKVMNLLKMVHLGAFFNRYPSQLSGGQRQRVALARALAVEPRILLLDEPFGALDAKVRQELRRSLRKLHENMGITTIFVTHDQEEAMEVSDRIVVMSSGKIEQIGTPEEIYNNPANGFVYDFIGNYNSFDGWLDEDGKSHLIEYNVVENEIKQGLKNISSGLIKNHTILKLTKKYAPFLIKKTTKQKQNKIEKIVRSLKGEGKTVRLFARPHEMFIAKKPLNDDFILAKIVHINHASSLVKIELERLNGDLIHVDITREEMEAQNFQKNETVFVFPKKTKVFG